jgi:hypothetical protein
MTTSTPHALEVAREISMYFPKAEAQEISLDAVAAIITREREDARRKALEKCGRDTIRSFKDGGDGHGSERDAARIRSLLAPAAKEELTGEALKWKMAQDDTTETTR